MLIDKDRLNRVESILVSQPDPQNGNSPYDVLRDKYNLKIDFRPFIHIEPVSLKDFRNRKSIS
jgi:uroporphyrinogen-III synthase